jgi:bacterioferritin-associated ferredoxin
MVPEELREVNIVGWRCVMCGEHIDPLILEHRRKMQTLEGAKLISDLAGKAAFN